MENIDRDSQYQKWVLINQPKMPQMPQNLSAQIVCPSPKVWDCDEKKASLGVRSPWIEVCSLVISKAITPRLKSGFKLHQA